MKLILKLIFSGFIFFSVVYAHDDHEEIEETKIEKVEKQVQNEKFIMPSIKDAIFKHLHNKLIHFPIALSVLSFFFFLISFKYPDFKKPAELMLLIAALFTIPVYFSGEAQIENFEKGAKEWLAEIHEEFGIFTIISIWLWLFVSRIKGIRKFAIVFGIITMILISITGFYGGILAH